MYKLHSLLVGFGVHYEYFGRFLSGRAFRYIFLSLKRDKKDATSIANAGIFSS